MTEKQTRFKQFVEDLKRRRVVRVAVAYIIISWVLLQVIDVLLPAFDVGEWVFRAFLTLAFIGFFITIILSWVFDINDHRVVKTSGKRLPRWGKSIISLPLIVLVGLGGWWVWSGYVTDEESELRPTESTELPIVAVMQFRNLTADPANDWLGEGLANLIRDNLTQSRFLRVVSPQKFRSIIGEESDPKLIAELSEEEGIGFILSGEMLITPGGISISSRLSDIIGGIDLSARQTENLATATLLSAAGPIAAQVKQGLNIPHTEQIDIFAADFASQNLTAYESYVAGLGFFLNYQYQQAEQAFTAALLLAPDFAVARYRLAYIQAATGRTDMAEENIRMALETSNIPDREKRYIEAAQALFARDYETASGLYMALLTEYPFEVEAREMLAKTYWGQYKAQDAVREMQILAAEEPQNEVIWSTLGGYLLAMGEFERAQPALEKFAKLAPDNANSYTLLGDSLRYQGDFNAAIELYKKALEIDPTMRGVATSLATIDYLQAEYIQAEQGFTSIADNATLTNSDRLDAMFALQSLQVAKGSFSAAEQLIERFSAAIQEEQIREALAASIRALLNLESGNKNAARDLSESAISLSPGVPTRYLFARGLVELNFGEYDKVSVTATEIISHALPADNPDRTEDKAAAYLTGMASLLQDDMDSARADLDRATELGGYDYQIYDLGLAQLLMQVGEAEDAIEKIQAAIIPDMVEPRIDLEATRVRALLLMAEIKKSTNDLPAAGLLAQQFLSRFSSASPDHPDVVLANNILSAAGLTFSPESTADR